MSLEYLLACVCDRCGHKWLKTSDELPKRCAKCKRPNWNTPTVQGEANTDGAGTAAIDSKGSESAAPKVRKKRTAKQKAALTVQGEKPDAGEQEAVKDDPSATDSKPSASEQGSPPKPHCYHPQLDRIPTGECYACKGRWR